MLAQILILKIYTLLTNVIMHPDRGSQYCSKIYQSSIRHYRFIPSMSRKFLTIQKGYYNKIRRHSAIDYKASYEVEYDLLKSSGKQSGFLG